MRFNGLETQLGARGLDEDVRVFFVQVSLDVESGLLEQIVPDDSQVPLRFSLLAVHESM
jgi:hypothetical protein